MFDTIRSVFRHPIFEPNHSTAEAQLPVASFRPLREYAPDGIAYKERRCAVVNITADFAGSAGVGEHLTTGPVYDNETIVDGLIVGDVACDSAGHGATVAVGTSAGSAANSLKTAANEDTYAVNVTLPMIPLGHGTGEVKLSADGFISFTVAVEAVTSGKFYVWYDVVFTGA
jgi:hypothetical protein